MKRRSFIKSAGLASFGMPLFLKDFNFGIVSKELFKPSRSAEDRVLIIIRLNGGNDGLNTLIPLDQYDNLVVQRQNILIPENQLLTIGQNNGLHPSMTGMANLFSDGKMSVIQNVGYPEQNRSHFRSMDIWTSGLMDPTATTGWMGRYFNNEHPGYPDNYPNDDFPDPFAISMGYEVSATCQGLMANFSHTVDNPLDQYNLFESGGSSDTSYYGAQIDFLSTVIAQANEYGASVYNAASSGSTLSTMYNAESQLAVQLRNVAKMISGGLKTKVYVLNVDGFDTHNAQVEEGAVTTGVHANLWKSISDAIAAFMDDMQLLNLDHRVAGMTFSEFGRQIASNASFGTDHGDAAPLFLFGGCTSSSIIGPNPVISDQVEDQAGVAMQIDFRDVYASILKDWFQADPDDIQAMFEHTVQFMPVLNGCTLGVDENVAGNDVLLFPNPCADFTTLRITCKDEKVTVRVLDINGRLVREVCARHLDQGSHDIPIELEGLSSGQYMVTIDKPSGNFIRKFIKVKHI